MDMFPILSFQSTSHSSDMTLQSKPVIELVLRSVAIPTLKTQE